jgi:hypothetical protein
VSKRKQTYPVAKTNSRGASEAAAAAAAAAARQRDRTVTIDLTALTRREGEQPKPGDRARVATGLFAGEIVTIESLAGGVIPSAVVRTDDGRTRRARLIDLLSAD